MRCKKRIRLFIVSKTTFLKNKSDIFDKLFSEEFDPDKEIILEGVEQDLKKPLIKKTGNKL